MRSNDLGIQFRNVKEKYYIPQAHEKRKFNLDFSKENVWNDALFSTFKHISYSLIFYISEANTIQKPVEVVIEDESRLNELGYCPPATSRHIDWNWTKPGETAILPCPLGTSGLARWRCLSSGTFIDCQNRELTLLKLK